MKNERCNENFLQLIRRFLSLMKRVDCFAVSFQQLIASVILFGAALSFIQGCAAEHRGVQTTSQTEQAQLGSGEQKVATSRSSGAFEESSDSKADVRIAVEDFEATAAEPNVQKILAKAVPAAISLRLLRHPEIQLLDRRTLRQVLKKSIVKKKDLKRESVF